MSKDRDLRDELRAHLDMATRDRVERGESPEAAAAAARREFGNVALVADVTRDMWRGMWFERLLQDLRYALRLLRRTPAFTVVAVASLALGIGASAAIFQVIDALRLRALPVNAPHELVEVAPASMDRARGNVVNWRSGATTAVWEQVRDHQQVFSGTLAWGSSQFNLASGGEVRLARGLWVSGGFFETLGVRPARGRLLTAADDTRGCAPRAVLSDAFFRREYGGDPALVGRTIALDGVPVEVVGVAAPGFFGLEVGRSFDVALPICAEPALTGPATQLASGTYWWLTIGGRLKPGVTARQADAHLQSLSASVFETTLPADYPAVSVADYRAMVFHTEPLGRGISFLREQYATPLWVLLALAVSVLLIGCANLANLMLARSSAREKEIAVRLGLGASRARIVRQLFTESLVLAAAGAAGGLVASDLLSAMLVSLVNADSSIVLAMDLDWRVLGFTAALAALTCLLFGLLPAVRATRTSAASVMKAAGRGLTSTRESARLRRVLVTVQVSVSLVLLVGALLFTRTLKNLTDLNPGFTAAGVTIASVDFRAANVAAAARRDYKMDLLRRIRALPGVEAAAATAIVPISGNFWGNAVTVTTAAGPRTAGASMNRVTDGYFRTMRTPMVAGRDFNDRDTPDAPLVAIVNEAFVRQLFDGGNAIGRRFSVEATPSSPVREFEIVGVVATSKYFTLRENTPPVVYYPMAQERESPRGALIAIRSSVDPAALNASVVRAMRDASPAIALGFSRLDRDIADTLVPERLVATVSVVFGSIAVVIAVIGLYGVMAYGVSRRTNEIGVRMALGASAGTVVSMILKEAAVVVLAGVLVGLAIAISTGKYAETLLFGMEPADPVSLAGGAALLATVALAAAYLPARNASKIPPTVALRLE
jgi:putative ABC transport system permease protein